MLVQQVFLRLQFWPNRKKILAETDQGWELPFFPLLFAIGGIYFLKQKRRKYF